MMKKYILVIAAVIAVAITATSEQKEWRTITPHQKLAAAESMIMKYYVDSIDENILVENAIRGLLETLDPHSTYSDKEETKELTEPLDGNFCGIGVEFNMQKDTLYVVQTVSGGPAEKVGIRPGDRIIAVNDTAIAGVKMRTKQIMKRLRGPKGTVVETTVKRHGSATPIKFHITRDDIPLYSIDASYMVDKRTGYIRLGRFSRTSVEEFNNALKTLKKKGMEQLILDLTDNGGGYLDIAATIANQFLERNEMIVYTEGKSQPRRNLTARGDGKLKKNKLVVMVNQFSASASEIVSGALQDWDRAVIVGRRTFGKGLVQQPVPFPDGTMIRLTISKYYTPSGRCIQKPYTIGDKDKYERDILDRFNNGELYSVDSTKFDEKMRYSTLKTKRTVFGGGGIMPDIFIPLDTTAYTKYYRELVAKAVPNNFAVAFVDKHRSELKSKYPKVEDFIKSFNADDTIMQELIDMGKNDSVKFNEKDYALSKNFLSQIVKAIIARDIYTRDAYFQVINPTNAIFQKAIAIINDDHEYNKILGITEENKNK